MNVYEMRQELFETLNAMKLTGNMSINIEEFSRYLNTIDAINALPANEFSFNGRPLTDWAVPSELGKLLIPASVKLEANPLAKDLIDRNALSFDVDNVMDYNEFYNFTCKLYNTQRKTPNFSESLTSLRKEVTLNDIKESMEMDGYVRYNETASMPIPILNAELFYSDAYVSLSVEEAIINVFREYIRKL